MPDSSSSPSFADAGAGDDALRLVKGACPHDCPDTCAMLVHVRDGVAIRVTGNPEHRPTGGVLCTKVSRYVERTYHHERLLHPMKRVGTKGEGRFERIGWDEALDTIATRLAAIAAVDPERIVPYSYAGTMGLVQGEAMAQRFFHKLGASRLHRSICSEAGVVGYELHARRARSARISSNVQDAKLIVFWGANAITSSVHFWSRAQEAKRRGARLIAIDPYRSLTAEKCHEHIAPLPGTDSALALGLMHVLIRDGLVDDDWVARHTLGFDALAERAASFPPEAVAAICGIDAVAIESLAHAYGEVARRGDGTLIRVNYGVQRAHGGGMAVRNIACLPALVGAFRHRGRRHPAVDVGHRATSTRAALHAARPARRTHAAHHQHDHDRRRSAAAGRRRLRRASRRSSSTTRIRSRSRRTRVAWRPASRARICSPSCSSTSRPTPPTTPTSCCPRPRSSSTSTSSSRTATTT